MIEHYPNAASRHLIDSKILLEASRWQGSAYLAGYTIECSLKAIISTPSTPDNIDLKSIGHDLSKLHHTINIMAASKDPCRKRNVPARLLTHLRNQIDTQTPEWKPSIRYQPIDAGWQISATSWWNLANRCFASFARQHATEV